MGKWVPLAILPGKHCRFEMEKKSERKWKPQTAGTLASLKFLGLPFFSFPRASAPVKRGCPCADEGRTGVGPRPRMATRYPRSESDGPQQDVYDPVSRDRTGLATLAKALPNGVTTGVQQRLQRGRGPTSPRRQLPKKPRVTPLPPVFFRRALAHSPPASARTTRSFPSSVLNSRDLCSRS